MMIQILLSLFCASIVIRAFRSWRNKAIRLSTFFFWTFFWLVMIILVWQPELTNRLAAFLQVGRGTDAVLYVSLVALFYLIYRLFVKLEAVEAELTTIIRELAIIGRKETKDS